MFTRDCWTRSRRRVEAQSAPHPARPGTHATLSNEQLDFGHSTAACQDRHLPNREREAAMSDNNDRYRAAVSAFLIEPRG